MTHPNGSIRQTSHGPRPQEANPPGGEAKTLSHRVYLGVEDVEGPGEIEANSEKLSK